MRRFAIALALVPAFALLAIAPHADAADRYPEHPIVFYVAFGPGGAGDIVARAVSREMTRNLGQAVVVENRPAPMAADVLVAKARPDGYSMIIRGNASAIATALFKQLPFDAIKDYEHVSLLAEFQLAMVTAADSPLRSVADVVAFAKANPGKLNIGTIRVGSTQQLTAELFRASAGIDAVLIPYRTSADLVTGLRAGDVQVGIEIVSPILSQLAAKTLRPIAVTAAERYAGLPGVPTIAETLPGFDATSWIGLSVPAGTPADIVALLNRQVRLAIATPSVQKVLNDAGIVGRASSGDEMKQRLAADIEKWRGVVDRAGIERK